MRGYLACIAASALGVLTQGCANSPLPQDVTGSTTADIVARVRCEARDAIREAALKELNNYDDVVYKDLTGKQLAEILDKDRRRFNEIGAPRFKVKELDKAFDYFRNAQMTYDFTLNLNEANTQGVNFDLVRTFARRIDSVGIGAKGERTRQTIRHFQVTDNFLVLATKVNYDYCEVPRPINLVYPIEGRLKINDLVDSFVFINKNGSFRGTPSGPAISTMSDTIVFSTKLLGNVSPTLALNPSQLYGFELSRVTLTNDNFREDRHQVIITTTLPKNKIFPYYPGANPRPFIDDDPRLLTAEASVRETRRRNFEDAVTQFGNSFSRMIGP